MAANRASLRKTEGLKGFVVNYLLCGPFNADCSLTSCQALEKDYLSTSSNETIVQPRAGMTEKDSNGEHLAWQPYVIRHGFVANLIARFSGSAMINYAAAYLYCPANTLGHILVGSDDGFKLWLNGVLVGQNHIHRGLGVDNDKIDVSFKNGINLLLIKIEHNFGGHEFCIRITDRNSKMIKGMYALLDHPDVKKPVDPAKQRTISSYDYLAYKFANAKPTMAFAAKNATQYKAWQKKFLHKFTELIGKPFAKCPLRSQITDETTVENFRHRRVLIDFETGFSIPCFVTEPLNVKKGQKLPAVLCLHGHGNGKSDMVGMRIGTPQETPWSKSYAIALHAARAGYITISPDFLAFGERLGDGSPFGAGQDPCPAEFAWAQMVGLVPTALNIHTVRRCIDYLQTLPYVDKNRIAAMGHSFGGYMTAMATAVEPRIKTAVISGFICSIAGYHGRTWSCGSQVVPGLLNYGDLSDIVCTLAPRPVLIITGMYDCVTPAPFAMAAFRKIKTAYIAAGVPEKTRQFTFDGEHLFQPEPAIKWLKEWL